MNKSGLKIERKREADRSHLKGDKHEYLLQRNVNLPQKNYHETNTKPIHHTQAMTLPKISENVRGRCKSINDWVFRDEFLINFENQRVQCIY